MASIPETGFLVIANLTDYTADLSGSELEHAPVIAGDLLESAEGWTRIRLRWEYQGTSPVDAVAVAGIRGERRAAFDRLAHVVTGALPVMDQREVTS